METEIQKSMEEKKQPQLQVVQGNTDVVMIQMLESINKNICMLIQVEANLNNLLARIANQVAPEQNKTEDKNG